MKTPAYFLVISLLAGLAGCSPQPKAAPEQMPPYDALIADVNVVDVAAEKVLAHQYVGLHGQRIAFVRATAPSATTQARRIDGTGKYLIPGLWDMHVHYDWNYEDATPLLLANGIVGVREMFGTVGTVKEIRRKTAAGKIYGPEIVTSGAVVDGPNPTWSGSVAVSDTATARRVVRRQAAEGADFVKVYSSLPRDAYFALAAEARKRGVPFAGHVPTDVSLYEAVAVGQRSAEHLYGLLEACSARPKAVDAPVKKSYWSAKHQRYLARSFSRPKFDSLLRVLAPNNTWLCPTLVVLRSDAQLNNPNFRQDKRVKFLPGYLMEGWSPRENAFARGFTNEDYAASKQTFELKKSLLGDMQKAGVKLLAGTDYPNPYCFPGFSLHDELQLMVEGGLTPVQALKTATVNPAAYLQKEADYGSIKPGQYASLLLLDANPLANIANTRKIHAVMLKGKYFPAGTLRQMLQQAEERASRIAVSKWFWQRAEAGSVPRALDQLDSLVRQRPEGYDYAEGTINGLGYALLSKQKVKEALRVFRLNTILYPASANVYDSYGEVLLAGGQKKLAIENYRKSLELDSANQSAREALEKLVPP